MAETATPKRASDFMQLEKADSRVNYRASDPQGWQCGGCRFYDPFAMECDLVEGTIDATYTCDLWTAPLANQPVESTDLSSGEVWREPTFQVFVEAGKSFADLTKPTWIPFLPKPGKFEHPLYGNIVVTPAQNQEMVDSVKNKVYQEHIPLDAEHETKLSGAVAWIKDMRMNDDGSADAFVEWTDRGRQLIGGGQFRYISPEWFSDWKDPATGVIHRNVVAGGAITTRPFFKERVLRALVASEAGVNIIKSDKEDKQVPDDKDPKKTAEPVAAATLTMAEVETKIQEARAADAKTFDEKIAKLTTDLEAANTLAAFEKTARETLATQLITRDKLERNRRFTDMVAGRGGDGDGAPWAGDAVKQVAILEKLVDQFGETDEMVVSHIEQQKAIAAQVKAGELFKEVGSGGSPVGGSDPERKLDDLAKARMKESKQTYAQAYSEVLESAEGAQLYGQIKTARSA